MRAHLGLTGVLRLPACPSFGDVLADVLKDSRCQALRVKPCAMQATIQVSPIAQWSASLGSGSFCLRTTSVFWSVCNWITPSPEVQAPLPEDRMLVLGPLVLLVLPVLLMAPTAS